MEENTELNGKYYKDGYFVSIVFDSCKPYYFHTTLDRIGSGEYVVVETARGIELGKCLEEPKPMSEFTLDFPLRDVVRVATQDDVDNYRFNLELAKNAHKICLDEIKKQELDMVLLKSEYTLDKSKIIFVFSSENRVDFRDLVKTLASVLKCRIELRQIGARDRSKIVGGLGPCGRELCCNCFLANFDTVSINMAKNQFLALNTQKLSGQCGKLMCCLRYEDEAYTEIRKDLPKVNSRIDYEGNNYKITSINVLTSQVRLENQDGILLVPLKEIQEILNGNK